MSEKKNPFRMEAREAIEAYIGQNGHICLKQESFVGEEPSIITLEPFQVPTVVKWLESLVQDSGK